MARKISDTSRLAYEKIMMGRDNHYKKIILAIEWIMEGNNWEIARQARLKPEQVWKRTGELCKPDENGESILFDTGKRNFNPDGNLAIIYAMASRKSEYSHVIAPERYNPDEKHVADYANVLIAKTKGQKLIQKDLFETS